MAESTKVFIKLSHHAEPHCVWHDFVWNIHLCIHIFDHICRKHEKHVAGKGATWLHGLQSSTMPGT